MSTQLAAQLRILSKNNSEYIHRHEIVSFLYDSKAKINELDLETIYDMANNGLSELINQDNTFKQYQKTLFLTSYRNSLYSIDKNITNNLKEEIHRFLLHISPYFLLKSTHKIIEYLLRRFDIHKHNIDSIMSCILPYHNTELFVRFIKIIKLDKNNKWSFLKHIKKTLQPLHKDILIKYCIKNYSIITYLSDTAKHMINYSFLKSIDLYFSFYTLCMTNICKKLADTNEIMNKNNHNPHEQFLALLMPYLIDGIKSNYHIYQYSSYMIIATVATYTSLQIKVNSSLISLICKYIDEKPNRQELYRLILFLINIYNHQTNLYEIPNKAFYKLISYKSLLIDILIQIYDDKYNIQPFISCFIHSICLHYIDYHDLLHELIQKYPSLHKNDISCMIKCFINLINNQSDQDKANSSTLPLIKQSINYLEQAYANELELCINELLTDDNYHILQLITLNSLCHISTSIKSTLLSALSSTSYQTRLLAIKELNNTNTINNDLESNFIQQIHLILMERLLYEKEAEILIELLNSPYLITNDDMFFNILIDIIKSYSNTTTKKYHELVLIKSFTYISNNININYINWRSIIFPLLLHYIPYKLDNKIYNKRSKKLLHSITLIFKHIYQCNNQSNISNIDQLIIKLCQNISSDDLITCLAMNYNATDYYDLQHYLLKQSYGISQWLTIIKYSIQLSKDNIYQQFQLAYNTLDCLLTIDNANEIKSMLLFIFNHVLNNKIIKQQQQQQQQQDVDFINSYKFLISGIYNVIVSYSYLIELDYITKLYHVIKDNNHNHSIAMIFITEIILNHMFISYHKDDHKDDSIYIQMIYHSLLFLNKLVQEKDYPIEQLYQLIDDNQVQVISSSTLPLYNMSSFLLTLLNCSSKVIRYMTIQIFQCIAKKSNNIMILNLIKQQDHLIHNKDYIINYIKQLSLSNWNDYLLEIIFKYIQDGLYANAIHVIPFIPLNKMHSTLSLANTITLLQDHFFTTKDDQIDELIEEGTTKDKLQIISFLIQYILYNGINNEVLLYQFITNTLQVNSYTIIDDENYMYHKTYILKYLTNDIYQCLSKESQLSLIQYLYQYIEQQQLAQQAQPAQAQAQFDLYFTCLKHLHFDFIYIKDVINQTDLSLQLITAKLKDKTSRWINNLNVMKFLFHLLQDKDLKVIHMSLYNIYVMIESSSDIDFKDNINIKLLVDCIMLTTTTTNEGIISANVLLMNKIRNLSLQILASLSCNYASTIVLHITTIFTFLTSKNLNNHINDAYHFAMLQQIMDTLFPPLVLVGLNISDLLQIFIKADIDDINYNHDLKAKVMFYVSLIKALAVNETKENYTLTTTLTLLLQNISEIYKKNEQKHVHETSSSSDDDDHHQDDHHLSSSDILNNGINFCFHILKQFTCIKQSKCLVQLIENNLQQQVDKKSSNQLETIFNFITFHLQHLEFLEQLLQMNISNEQMIQYDFITIFKLIFQYKEFNTSNISEHLKQAINLTFISISEIISIEYFCQAIEQIIQQYDQKNSIIIQNILTIFNERINSFNQHKDDDIDDIPYFINITRLIIQQLQHQLQGLTMVKQVGAVNKKVKNGKVKNGVVKGDLKGSKGSMLNGTKENDDDDNDDDNGNQLIYSYINSLSVISNAFANLNEYKALFQQICQLITQQILNQIQQIDLNQSFSSQISLYIISLDCISSIIKGLGMHILPMLKNIVPTSLQLLQQSLDYSITMIKQQQDLEKSNKKRKLNHVDVHDVSLTEIEILQLKTLTCIKCLLTYLAPLLNPYLLQLITLLHHPMLTRQYIRLSNDDGVKADVKADDDAGKADGKADGKTESFTILKYEEIYKENIHQINYINHKPNEK